MVGWTIWTSAEVRVALTTTTFPGALPEETTTESSETTPVEVKELAEESSEVVLSDGTEAAEETFTPSEISGGVTGENTDDTELMSTIESGDTKEVHDISDVTVSVDVLSLVPAWDSQTGPPVSLFSWLFLPHDGGGAMLS